MPWDDTIDNALFQRVNSLLEKLAVCYLTRKNCNENKENNLRGAAAIGCSSAFGLLVRGGRRCRSVRGIQDETERLHFTESHRQGEEYYGTFKIGCPHKKVNAAIVLPSIRSCCLAFLRSLFIPLLAKPASQAKVPDANSALKQIIFEAFVSTRLLVVGLRQPVPMS